MRLRHLVHIHLVVAQLREVHLQLAGHRGGLRIVTVILAHGVLERLIGISRLRGRRTVIRHRLDGEREHAILQRGTNQSLGHIDARVGTRGRIDVGERGGVRHLPVGIRRRLLVVVRNRRGQLTGVLAVLDIGHCVRHRGRMAVIRNTSLIRVGRLRLVHIERIRARLGEHQVAHTEGCRTRRVTGACDLNLSRQIAGLIGVGSLPLGNDLVFNRIPRRIIRWRQGEVERIARLPRTPSQRLLHSNRCRRRLRHRVGVLERDISTRVRQLRAVGLPIRGRGGQALTRPRLVINLLVLHQHVVHRIVVAYATGRRCIGILDLGHLVHVGEVLALHRIGDLRERSDTVVIVLRRGRGGRAPLRHGDLAGTDAVGGGELAEIDGSTRHGIILHPAECLELERELILHKRICTGLVGIRLLHVEGDGLLIGVIGVRDLGDFVSDLDRVVLLAHTVVGVGLLHLDCRLRQRAVAVIPHRHRDAVGSARIPEPGQPVSVVLRRHGLGNEIGVGAGLGVLNIAEVELVPVLDGLHNLRHTTHGRILGTVGHRRALVRAQVNLEAIATLPVTALEHLLCPERIGELHRRLYAVGVRERQLVGLGHRAVGVLLRDRAGDAVALAAQGVAALLALGQREAGRHLVRTGQFLHRVGVVLGETVHADRLAVRDGLLAAVLEVEYFADLLLACGPRVLKHRGLVRLPRRRGHGELEGEPRVRFSRQARWHHDLLRHLEARLALVRYAHTGGARKQGIQVHVVQIGAGALRISVTRHVLGDTHTYPARLGLQAVGFALLGGPILVHASVSAVLEVHCVVCTHGFDIGPRQVAFNIGLAIRGLPRTLDPRERVVDVALCAKLAQTLHERARAHERRNAVIVRTSIGMDAVIVHNHLGERVVKQEALGRRDLL